METAAAAQEAEEPFIRGVPAAPPVVGTLVTRPGHTTNPPRSHGNATPARSAHTASEERPFADIRRNIQDALRIISVHRWAFLIPFGLAASAVFVLSLSYQRTYVATTIFERRADPIMDDLPTRAVTEAYEYFRSTMVRDLTSIEYMSRVADAAGQTDALERNADGTFTERAQKERTQIAGTLRSRVGITSKSVTPLIDQIKITYTGIEPGIGRRVVAAVKKLYTDHNIEWMADYLEAKRSYFAQEAESARDTLNARLRKQTDKFLANPHYNPHDPSAVANRIAQLDAERRDLSRRRREYDTDLMATRRKLSTLSQPLASPEGSANRGDAVVSLDAPSLQAKALVDQIDKITREIEHRRMLKGMTDEHPEVKERVARRAWLETMLSEQRGRDREAVANTPLERNPTGGFLDEASRKWHQELALARIDETAHQDRIRQIDISLETNEQALSEMRKAKEQVYLKQEAFAAVQGEVAKARAGLAAIDGILGKIEPAIKAVRQDRLLKFADIRVASGGDRPISPKPSIIVLFAIVAGLIVGAAFAILAEVFDGLYRSSAQVARSLGLPILEAIDEIATAQCRRRAIIRRLVVVPLVSGGLLLMTCISGSMAFLSLQEPETYAKIIAVPRKALNVLGWM